MSAATAVESTAFSTISSVEKTGMQKRTVPIAFGDKDEDDATSKNHPSDYHNSHRIASSVSSIRSQYSQEYNLWKGIWYWFRLPGSLSGHMISVDLTATYRRQLVWAKQKDGATLLNTVTSRYQSTSVILSLFLGSATAVFFSPADVVTEVRQALRTDKVGLHFYTGVALSVCILATLGALIANITAWNILAVLSKENASTILRSSLGLYAAQLPSRLVVITIYLYFVWVAMFWFILMPEPIAIVLTVIGVLLLSHIASTYSAMGQVIMATSAMSSERIIPKEDEEKMMPKELYRYLVWETNLAKKAKVPVNQQYRMDNYKEHLREFVV